VDDSQWKKLEDFRDSMSLSPVQEESRDDAKTTVVLRSHDEDARRMYKKGGTSTQKAHSQLESDAALVH